MIALTLAINFSNSVTFLSGNRWKMAKEADCVGEDSCSLWENEWSKFELQKGHGLESLLSHLLTGSLTTLVTLDMKVKPCVEPEVLYKPTLYWHRALSLNFSYVGISEY